MTRAETAEILAYLMADFGEMVPPSKIQVWFDQLKEIPIQHAWTTARIMMGRKMYGVPKVQDFLESYKDIARPERNETWAEAFDLWVDCARKYGCYRRSTAFRKFKEQSPKGAKALGSMVNEWFEIETSQISTFRSQFMKKYEAINQRDDRMMIPSHIQEEVTKLGIEHRRIQSNAVAGLALPPVEDRRGASKSVLEKPGGAAVLLLRKAGIPPEA